MERFSYFILFFPFVLIIEVVRPAQKCPRRRYQWFPGRSKRWYSKDETLCVRTDSDHWTETLYLHLRPCGASLCHRAESCESCTAPRHRAPRV